MKRLRADDGTFKGGGPTKGGVEAEYGLPRRKLDSARKLYYAREKAGSLAAKQRAGKLFEAIRAGEQNISSAIRVFERKPSPVVIHRSPTWVPDNLILGFTLETNRDAGYEKISKAPAPSVRYQGILRLIEDLVDGATGTTAAKSPNTSAENARRKARSKLKIMVTIDPCLAFDHDEFAEMIRAIEPCLLWMGYDSKGCQMPEPTEEEFRKLHWTLAEAGLNVVLKKPYPGKRRPGWHAMYAASVQQMSPFMGCEHDCTYCRPSFQAQAKRRPCPDCRAFKPHYTHFKDRLDVKAFRPTRFGEFIFLCSMGDVAFCDDKHFWEMIKTVRSLPDRTFVLQTKDPEKAFMREVPKGFA